MQSSTAPATSVTPANELNQFVRRSIHPHLVAQCANLFYRQSLINDYLDCPQMALYRWVLNLDQAAPFMSATLGTAGHAVAFRFHVSRKYDYTYLEILEMLEDEFNRQIAKDAVYPQLPKNCDSPAEAFSLKGPEYAKLLYGYQYHRRNRAFHSTFHEQSFVLEIPTGAADGSTYLFTGQIDQGGFYDDGNLSVRDFKFRDNGFRPSKVQLNLNVQATIYCTAVRFGKPACERCRPRYERDELENTVKLVYEGPCDSCTAKMGTPLWPMKFPNLFEFIWMNDFDVHEKDQHDTEVIDYDRPKIPNPKGKGQKVYQRKPNPEWGEGYKKGEYKGPCFLQTVRPPSSLNIMMSNVLEICDQIKRGIFYRKPGDSCNFWCKHRDACLKGMELEIQEAALDQVTAIGTEDPW
jgi:hypothetical protein